MLKILQPRLQQHVDQETSRCTSWVSKRERNQRSNCQCSLGHRESKGIPKSIYFCLIDSVVFDCVDHNKQKKMLKEMEIPDHLTCILRNLYAGQEATVRTRRGRVNYFTIGKGVRQGFNVYVESVQFSSVQSLSHVQLLATPWIAARQASLPITNSQSSLRLTSIESVMPSSHLILCHPLLFCPQSLLASGSFPMSQLFAWGGQSIGVSASASFPPKKSQGWSPSE